jgi:hypothetical protein
MDGSETVNGGEFGEKGHVGSPCRVGHERITTLIRIQTN